MEEYPYDAIIRAPTEGESVLMTEWTAMLRPSMVPVEEAGTTLVTADWRMELIRDREQTRGICSNRKSVMVDRRESR